ncbi:MAG: hypothetical protein ACI8PP_001461 [Candidatus Pseudothioglobus sp.]|jgi:hypothetical protein
MRNVKYIAGDRRGGWLTLIRLGVMLTSMTLFASCTTSVTVEGSSPTPLVKKIPARIGVYYSDAFKTFRHDEKIERSGSWVIDFGVQNLSFFRNLTSAMFNEVVEVNKSPVDAAMMPGLEGILVPEIQKFGFLTPGVSGLNFYSASVHYRMSLYNAKRQKVSEWSVVGYGKSEASVFGSKEALNEATMLAIRDGGARIAVEFSDQPGVNTWVQNLTPSTAADGDAALKI